MCVKDENTEQNLFCFIVCSTDIIVQYIVI